MQRKLIGVMGRLQREQPETRDPAGARNEIRGGSSRALGCASPERKSNFSLISKTHHFLLRENDEFLLLSKPHFFI
ncbi:MAG: hypothetical protein GX072_07165 [Lysinibacillus sp.]|nr:hypothetical protein [Lysinibacillus sp.]